jgi:hypothetical protein
MGAGSRFDQPLTLIEDGRKVVACGPLGFEENEVSAEVSIDLTQLPGRGDRMAKPVVKASASGVFVNHKHDPDPDEEDEEDEWMLTAAVVPKSVGKDIKSAAWTALAFEVAPPGELVIAHGVIRYLRIDGTVDVKKWTGDGPDKGRLQTRWQ